MASSATYAWGLRPAYGQHMEHAPKAYTINAAYAQNIFCGDPVRLAPAGGANAGTIVLATDNADRSTGGSGTTPIMGVFAGVRYIDSTGKPCVSAYWPGAAQTMTAATNITCYVADDEGTEFIALFANPGTAGTTDTTVYSGSGASWVYNTTNGGNLNSGNSTAYLARATGVTAPGIQFTLIAPALSVSDNVTDAYVPFRVKVKSREAGPAYLITANNT